MARGGNSVALEEEISKTKKLLDYIEIISHDKDIEKYLPRTWLIGPKDRSKLAYSKAYYKRVMDKTYNGTDFSGIDDLNICLALNPYHVQALYRRGKFNLKHNHYRKAIADFDRIININPNYVDVYLQRSFAKHKLGIRWDAEEDRKKMYDIIKKNGGKLLGISNKAFSKIINDDAMSVINRIK